MLSVRARLASVTKRSFATVTEAAKPDQKFKVVVVGGGPGGLSGKKKKKKKCQYVTRVLIKFYNSVSSTVSKLLGKNQVAVIEPSSKHYVRDKNTYYTKKNIYLNKK